MGNNAVRPRTGRVRSTKEEAVTGPQTRLDDVFRIPLLQEKILNYAIYTNDGSKLSRANTLSYYGVNRAWMGAVVQHLERIGEPVLKFAFDGIPCAGRPLASNTRFRKFLEAFDGSPRELDWIPPFELTVDLYHGHLEKTVPYLGQCFQHCGAGLLKLKLRFMLPLNCSESDKDLLRQTFELVSLPVLKTFKVEFFYRPLYRDMDSNLGVGKNLEIVTLIQSILDGGEQLRIFSLKSGGSKGALPRDLKNMGLPTTLRTLKVTKSSSTLPSKGSSDLVPEPLEGEGQLPDPVYDYYGLDFAPLRNGMIQDDLGHLLEHNTLPQLTLLSVHLRIGEGSCIYKIMEKVAMTLRVLKIRGEFSIHHKIPLKFPWMRRLEWVHFQGKGSKWVEHYVDGGKGTPKAVKVTLPWVTEEHPLEASRFTSVEELAVKLGQRPGIPILTADMSARLHRAFPRITRLTLELTLKKGLNEGLNYIFKNMTLLQALSIGIMDDAGSPNHYCSSLLLSRTPQIIEFWENDGNNPFIQRYWSNSPPPIVNLTNLRELTLGSSPAFKGARVWSNKVYLLSDAVFQFALLKMPKLQNVRLWDNVKASPEQMKIWREDDRQIQWEATPPSDIRSRFFSE